MPPPAFAQASPPVFASSGRARVARARVRPQDAVEVRVQGQAHAASPVEGERIQIIRTLADVRAVTRGIVNSADRVRRIAGRAARKRALTRQRNRDRRAALVLDLAIRAAAVSVHGVVIVALLASCGVQVSIAANRKRAVRVAGLAVATRVALLGAFTDVVAADPAGGPGVLVEPVPSGALAPVPLPPEPLVPPEYRAGSRSCHRCDSARTDAPPATDPPVDASFELPSGSTPPPSVEVPPEPPVAPPVPEPPVPGKPPNVSPPPLPNVSPPAPAVFEPPVSPKRPPVWSLPPPATAVEERREPPVSSGALVTAVTRTATREDADRDEPQTNRITTHALISQIAIGKTASEKDPPVLSPTASDGQALGRPCGPDARSRDTHRHLSSPTDAAQTAARDRARSGEILGELFQRLPR